MDTNFTKKKYIQRKILVVISVYKTLLKPLTVFFSIQMKSGFEISLAQFFGGNSFKIDTTYLQGYS